MLRGNLSKRLLLTTACLLCSAFFATALTGVAEAKRPYDKPKTCVRDAKRCAEPGVIIGLQDGDQRPVHRKKPRRITPVPVKGAAAPAARPATAPSAGAAEVSPADAAVTIYNRDFELADPNNPAKADNWIDYWRGGYTRVVLAAAAAAEPTSPAALQVTLTGQAGGGGETNVVIGQTETTPVFVGIRMKGQNVVARPSASGWYWGAHLIVEFFGKNAGEYAYCSTPPAAGTFGWRWVGMTSTSCGITFPIDNIWVEAVLEDATGTAYFDLAQLNIAPSALPIGAVTFQFDDGHISGRTAEDILTARSFVGSQAIVTNWINDDDSLSAADLKRIQGKGWDILSHSLNHPYMSQLTDAQATNQLTRSRTKLQSLGLTVDAFAWPYGDYNQKLVGFAQAIPYTSTRGYFDGDNPILTFPHDVRVHPLTIGIESDTQFTQVRAWLDQAANNHRWAILGMHQIVALGDDEYYNTPGYLTQLADLVKTYVDQGRLRVINYRTGINEFAVLRQ